MRVPLGDSDDNILEESHQSLPRCWARLVWFSLTVTGLLVGACACRSRRSPEALEVFGAVKDPDMERPARSRSTFGSLEAPGMLPRVVLSWADNLDRCVGVQGGLSAAKKTAHLELVSCSEEDALAFLVPTPTSPQLRLAAKPEICVDNPGAVELQLWNCSDSHAEDSIKFSLQATGEDRSVGTIRPFKNKSRCMNVPRDEIGAPVQVWECFHDFHHELFQLRVEDLGASTNGSGVAEGEAQARHMVEASPKEVAAPSGGEIGSPQGNRSRGVLIAIALFRSQMGDLEQCLGVPGGLKAAKTAEHLRLVRCTEEDALVFSVPTASTPQLRLIVERGLCVGNPRSTGLQLWDCNDTSVEESITFLWSADVNDEGVGNIRTMENQTRCMDCLAFGEGAYVQVRECLPDSSHQLFRLRVADGDAAVAFEMI